MSAERHTWEVLTSDYIRKVEHELAQVDHPRKKEVLQDLRDHLEQRFTDVPPEERTHEQMAAIIEDMGPPEEYAELLQPSAIAGPKSWFFGRRLRWIAGVVVGLSVFGFLVLSVELLVALSVVMFGSMAVVLLMQYRRTRDPGFIWLAIPLLIGPLFGTALHYWNQHVIDRLMSGTPVDLYPYSLVAEGKMALGTFVAAQAQWAWLVKSGLVLVGLASLYRGKQRPVSGEGTLA